MAVLNLTLRGARLETARRDGEAPECGLDAIRQAVARTPPTAPIVFFVHGYRYDPTAPAGSRRLRRRDPHTRVLAADASAMRCGRRWRSWPALLGFSADGAGDGLAICFGWNSLPTAGARRSDLGNSVAWAYAAAGRASEALAAALATTAAQPEARSGAPRIGVYAHSLGARIALLALRRGAAQTTRSAQGGGAETGWPRALRAVVLLGAAEYAAVARRTTRALGADGPDIVNLVSRENDLFDYGLSLLRPRRDAPLGWSGLGASSRRWLDLQIDAPETTRWLAAQGAPIGGRRRTVCHWSFYTRPGIETLHRRLLRDGWPIAEMRAAHAPETLTPPWTGWGVGLRTRHTPATQGQSAPTEASLALP